MIEKKGERESKKEEKFMLIRKEEWIILLLMKVLLHCPVLLLFHRAYMLHIKCIFLESSYNLMSYGSSVKFILYLDCQFNIGQSRGQLIMSLNQYITLWRRFEDKYF